MVRDYEYYTGTNRLKRTSTDGGATWFDYGYDHITPGNDKHGMICSMPHLALTWTFKEEVASSTAQYVTSGPPPQVTYYHDDSKGKRLRRQRHTLWVKGGGEMLKLLKLLKEPTYGLKTPASRNPHLGSPILPTFNNNGLRINLRAFRTKSNTDVNSNRWYTRLEL